MSRSLCSLSLTLIIFGAGCHWRSNDVAASSSALTPNPICGDTPDGGVLPPATLHKLKDPNSCATDQECINLFGFGTKCTDPDFTGRRCVKACTEDVYCPGGSYCDQTNNWCNFDCDGASSGNYQCTAPATCGPRGRCGPCTMVGTQPLLGATPAGVTLHVPSAFNTEKAPIDVTLVEPILDLQNPPPLNATVNVTVSADIGTLVSCDPHADTNGATFTASCALSSWTYVVDPNCVKNNCSQTAHNKIFIRLAPQAGQLTNPSFQVNITSKEVANSKVSVTVKPLPLQPQAVFADGKYVGQLMLKADPYSTGSQPGDAVVTVTGYASGGHLVLVDPTSSVTASGIIHLVNTARGRGILAMHYNYVDTFLTGGAFAGLNGQMAVNIRSGWFNQDAPLAPLTGSFSVSWPQGNDTPAMSYELFLNMTDLTLACQSDPRNPNNKICPAGKSCDPNNLCRVPCGTGGVCDTGTTCDTTSFCAPLPLPPPPKTGGDGGGGPYAGSSLSSISAQQWNSAVWGVFNGNGWSDGNGGTIQGGPLLQASTSATESQSNGGPGNLYIVNYLYGQSRHTPWSGGGGVPDDSNLVGWGAGGMRPSDTLGYDVCVRDIANMINGSESCGGIKQRTDPFSNGCTPSPNPYAGPYGLCVDTHQTRGIPVCDRLYGTLVQDGSCNPMPAWQAYYVSRRKQNMVPCYVEGTDVSSCQTMWQHAVNSGQMVPTATYGAFLSQCEQTDTVVQGPGDPAPRNVALCPLSSMFGSEGSWGAGQVPSSAVAERFACYDPLRPKKLCNFNWDCPSGTTCDPSHVCLPANNVNLDPLIKQTVLESTTFSSNTLQISGDLSCALDIRWPSGTQAPLPQTFPIFNQLDQVLLAPAPGQMPQTMLVTDMYQSCLADLALTPVQAANGGDGSPEETLASLFQRRACVSLARFYPSLSGGANRYLIRLLQQWLSVHSFVAEQGVRKWWVDRDVIDDGGDPTVTPPVADISTVTQLLDPVDNGFGFVMGSLSTLESLPAAMLASPDYRSDHGVNEPNPIADHDQGNGLSVAMLDGMSGYLNLLELYAKRASTSTYEQCKAGQSSTRAAAMARIGNAMRMVNALVAVATQLHDKAAQVQSPLQWEQRWVAVRNAFMTKRARFYNQVRELGNCESFLGIDDNSVPLYFDNPLDPAILPFPATHHVLPLAQQAVNDALTALANLRKAHIDQDASQVQQILQNQAGADHARMVSEKYGTTLLQLCGAPDSNATAMNMLDYFRNNKITADNCYLVANCNNSGTTPNPLCLRGELGKATMSMVAANQDILLAKSSWKDANEKLRIKSDYCSQYAQSVGAQQDIIASHMRSMDNMEEALRTSDFISGMISTAVEFCAGAAATVATGGAAAPVFAAAIGGSLKTFTGDIKHDMSESERDFQAWKDQVALQDKLDACWAEESQYRVGIDTLWQTVDRRTTDFQIAGLSYKNMLDQVHQLVAEGLQAQDVEAHRAAVQIAHSFYFNEQLTAFQKAFDDAQRIAYIAAQAVEFETQRTLGVRGPILAATHPNQIKDQVTLLAKAMGTNMIGGSDLNGGLQITQQHLVVGLIDPKASATDPTIGNAGLLGLKPPSQTGGGYDPYQELKSMLSSPSHSLYNQHGAYVGQAISFSITPNTKGLNGFTLSNLCDERISRIAGLISLDHAPPDGGPVEVLLLKRNTFATQLCYPQPGGSSMQTESFAPWVDPFLGTSGAPTGSNSQTPTQLGLDWNRSLADLYPNAPNLPDSMWARELEDMGLYGEYTLVIPWDATLSSGAVRLTQLNNVYLRFDMVAGLTGVSANPTPPHLPPPPVIVPPPNPTPHPGHPPIALQ